MKLASLSDDVRRYAEKVVSSNPAIEGVYLVGSSVMGTGRDIDLLYDFGQLGLGPNAEDEIETLLEAQNAIDLDTYDTFVWADNRYFHLSMGAGRSVVENTEYGKAQINRPMVKLAMADMGAIQNILTEMMSVLPAGMARPQITIVNHAKSSWLGRCAWRYGSKDGIDFYDPNSTIELQKRILSHEETLRRVLAHELCHHWEFIEYVSPEVKRLTSRTYKLLHGGDRQHGPQWRELASVFNAKYGKDFITEKSDEDFVIDHTDLRPYFILLHQMPNGHTHFQVSLRLSPKQNVWLKKHEGHAEYRLVKTQDPDFLRGPGIGSGRWAYARKDDPTKEEKLKAMWAEAPTKTSSKIAWQEIVIEEKNDEGPTADLLGGLLESNADLKAWATNHEWPASMVAFFMRLFRGKIIAVIDDLRAYDRGKGWGTKLITQFLAKAKAAGCDGIILVAGTQEKQEKGFNLVKWYEQMGFTTVGHSFNMPLMVKWLKPQKKKAAGHWLYHGTSRDKLDNILANGLLAANSQSHNEWTNAIYLACNEDTARSYAADNGVVLRIDVRKLNKEHLRPDDYEFPDAWANGQVPQNVMTMSGGNWAHASWRTSLKYTCQCAYLADIPANAITVCEQRTEIPSAPKSDWVAHVPKEKLDGWLRVFDDNNTLPYEEAVEKANQWLKTAKTSAKNATTQINLPEEMAWKIKDLVKQIIPVDDLMGDGYEENPHITVKYGVNEDEEGLRQAIDGEMEFEIAFGKTMVFPPSKSSDGAAVVVIQIEAPELHQLHDVIDSAIGNKKDDFPYKPHATLAYVKPEISSKYEGLDFLEGVKFTASEITISKKDRVQVAVELIKIAASDDTGSALHVGVDTGAFSFPPAGVIVRFPQKGMRWRTVLKIVKQIVGEVVGQRVPWKSIYVWENPWSGYREQQEQFPVMAAKQTVVMYDILEDGSHQSVGKPWVPVQPQLRKGAKERAITWKSVYTLHDEIFALPVRREWLKAPYNAEPMVVRQAYTQLRPQIGRLVAEFGELVAVEGAKSSERWLEQAHGAMMRAEAAAQQGDYEKATLQLDAALSEVHTGLFDTEFKTASHKVTPLSDTTFPNLGIGQETNAYADIPERVEGTQMVPSLMEMIPADLLKKSAEHTREEGEEIVAALREMFPEMDIKLVGSVAETGQSENDFDILVTGEGFDEDSLQTFIDTFKELGWDYNGPVSHEVYGEAETFSKGTGTYHQWIDVWFAEGPNKPTGKIGSSIPLPTLEQLLETEGTLYEAQGEWDKIRAEAEKRTPNWANISEAEREKIIDEEGMEWLRRTWAETEARLRALHFPLTVYRAICGSDLRDVDAAYEHPVHGKGIGVYWSYDERSAYVDKELVDTCEEIIVLRGVLQTDSAANWRYTSWLNLVAEDEREIRLNPGAQIEITGWKKRGEGEWRKPTPKLRNVTASDPTDAHYWSDEKIGAYAEAQNQSQHTDHQSFGMYKTPKSDPFQEEMDMFAPEEATEPEVKPSTAPSDMKSILNRTAAYNPERAMQVTFRFKNSGGKAFMVEAISPEGKPVGYVVVKEDGEDFYTAGSGLTPDWRGIGVAPRMYTAAMEEAKKRGGKRLRSDNELSHQAELAWGRLPGVQFDEDEGRYFVKLAAEPSSLLNKAANSFPPFEKFVRQRGGLRKFIDGFGDAWAHYVDIVDMENNNNLGDLPKGRQEELIKRHILNDMEERYYNATHELNSWTFPMTVYREITLQKIEDLRTQKIGDAWSYDERAASAHWGQFGQGYKKFLLIAKITENNIDWETTLLLNLDPSLGEEEKEVRLKEGTNFELVGYKEERGEAVSKPMTVTAAMNRISLQEAKDRKMFGPVYHGTTQDRRQQIGDEGFKVFEGDAGSGDVAHGYLEKDYHGGIPAPVHHLGYGVYFTTSKTIAKQFAGGTTRGMKVFYLDVPQLETINFGAPKTMMKWWLSQGYDGELAKTDRVAATKKLTDNLKSHYDAVWFKGRSMYRLLDGDQIVVFDPSRVYEIDQTLSKPGEIGSVVVRNIDGMKGRIMDIRPIDPEIAKQYHRGNPRFIEVKWQRGGTDPNVKDDEITIPGKSAAAGVRRWYHGTSLPAAEKIEQVGFISPGMPSSYHIEVPRQDCVYITSNREVAHSYAGDQGYVFQVLVEDESKLVPDEDAVFEALDKGEGSYAPVVQELFAKFYQDGLEDPTFESAWAAYGEMLDNADFSANAQYMKEFASWIADTQPTVAKRIIREDKRAAHIGPIKIKQGKTAEWKRTMGKTSALAPAARTLYHGTNSEQEFDEVKPDSYGIIWLAEKEFANDYTKYNHRTGEPRLFEIQLSPDAKLIDLRELSDPIVRTYKDKYYPQLPDEKWADAAMWTRIEGNPVTVPYFKQSGVDGIIVGDQLKRGRPHDSIALINPNTIVGQRKVAKGKEIGQVYLLHFDIPAGSEVPSSRGDASKPFHARHYLGWAEDAQKRIKRHYRNDSGVKLINALHAKGVTFTVARIWDNVDREFERSLKDQGGLSRQCPICEAQGLIPASRYRGKALKDVQVAPETTDSGPDFMEE